MSMLIFNGLIHQYLIISCTSPQTVMKFGLVAFPANSQQTQQKQKITQLMAQITCVHNPCCS